MAALERVALSTRELRGFVQRRLPLKVASSDCRYSATAFADGGGGASGGGGTVGGGSGWRWCWRFKGDILNGWFSERSQGSLALSNSVAHPVPPCFSARIREKTREMTRGKSRAVFRAPVPCSESPTTFFLFSFFSSRRVNFASQEKRRLERSSECIISVAIVRHIGDT